ncbi:lipase family protein [Nocardia sp. NPDC050712]|uniref:lipase family protein n=1 Tax=Nocardia sp. NPDC050712 TaxID=3155518 RepID=UPI003401F353
MHRHSRRCTARFVALTFSVSLTTALACLVPAAADPAPVARITPAPTADQLDPFYAAPPGFERAEPGTVLRTRQVTLLPVTTLARHRSWQLLYRTTTADGAPMVTVTTVVAPLGAAAGLLSYQFPEDASAAHCAPSQAMTTLSSAANTASAVVSEIPGVRDALLGGFAVSIPDYQGPDSRYGAPRQPGYAILDGLRAARDSGVPGLPADPPTALWGYSGGSLATGWAAQLAAAYAPELKITGSAVGGFFTEFRSALRAVNASRSAGLIPAILPGLLRGAPAVATEFGRVLTPEGAALLSAAGQRCAAENVVAHLDFDLSEHLSLPFDSFLATPSAESAFATVDLGGTTPSAPLFVYHAIHDELIPIASTDAIVDRYCADGADITYLRGATTDHLSMSLRGAPTAFAWLQRRLAGDPVTPGCSTQQDPAL